MNLELLDLMVRGGVIALLCLGAIQITRANGGRFRRLTWIALAIGMAFYALASAPAMLDGRKAVCVVVRVVPIINPFLLWWAGLSLFQDRFRPRLWHIAPAGAMFAPLIAPELGPIRAAAILGLYGHLFYVAVATAGDDLVAARIVFRRAFLVAATLVALAITAVEVLSAPPFPPWLFLLQATALLLLAGAFTLWISRARPDVWEEPRRTPRAANGRSPLARKLHAAMENGVWRAEGLTISALAAQLNAPEHRLRKVINGELGHRNFSAFINERRIAFAKQSLIHAPETPVLTIAYESGFASLGPFNRAFRESTGMSPTEFRKRTPADPENS